MCHQMPQKQCPVSEMGLDTRRYKADLTSCNQAMEGKASEALS